MISTQDVETFCASFAPWGYRDIETALETYKEAGKNEAELAEAVQSYNDDMGTKLEDIDVCYIAYDSLHQEARTDIEQKTSKDICNDAPYHGVNVYGNYMCTDFDGTTDAREAVKTLIETIPEGARTPAIVWLHSKM